MKHYIGQKLRMVKPYDGEGGNGAICYVVDLTDDGGLRRIETDGTWGWKRDSFFIPEDYKARTKEERFWYIRRQEDCFEYVPTAYHVPTKEAYRKQVQEWLDQGLKWRSGSEEVLESQWDKHREDTCVHVDEDGHIYLGRQQYYEQQGYEIIPWEEDGLGMKGYGHFRLPPGGYFPLTYASIYPEPKAHKKKFMSVLKQLAKSKVQKALEHYGLIDDRGDLTEKGHREVTAYIFENGAFDRKDFETKLVKAWEEETK